MKLKDLNKVTKHDQYRGIDIEYWQYFIGKDYRFLDTDVDAMCNNKEIFKTEEDATKYAESLDLEIGFYPEVEQVLYEVGKEDENVDVEDVEYNVSWVEVDTIWNGETNEGKNIKGAILIEWSYEKYVGYARNLINIGIAGEYPFHNFENEADLISGNEDRTFGSNYSVLLDAEEIEGLSENDLYNLIEDRLYESHWKWNHFKNNPRSGNIKEQIEEIAKVYE